MAKAIKRAFVCNECGADYPRWQGQCSACQAWNSITEVRLAASPAVARAERLSGYAGDAGVSKVQKLSEISLKHCHAFQPDSPSLTESWGAAWCQAVRFLSVGIPARGKVLCCCKHCVSSHSR